MPNVSQLREKINHLETKKEVEEELTNYFEKTKEQ